MYCFKRSRSLYHYNKYHYNNDTDALIILLDENLLFKSSSSLLPQHSEINYLVWKDLNTAFLDSDAHGLVRDILAPHL